MTKRETLTREEMAERREAMHVALNEGWAYDPVTNMYHRTVAAPARENGLPHEITRKEADEIGLDVRSYSYDPLREVYTRKPRFSEGRAGGLLG